MSATIINLPNHPAIKPRIDAGRSNVAVSDALSDNLTVWADSVAVISCQEGKGLGFNTPAFLWRLSQGLEKMAKAADKLERKYRKAKKRAKR